MLWKKDYEAIAANRAYFGDFDPFGDFDLLFGAARLNRKIVDLPVRYRSAHLRGDEHPALEARRAAVADGGVRRFAREVHVMQSS